MAAFELAVLGYDDFVRVAVAGGLLLAVVTVAGLLMKRVRQRSLSKSAAETVDFSVDDLEGLKRSGLISDEEFRQLRRRALGMAKPPGPVADRSAGQTPPDNDNQQQAT